MIEHTQTIFGDGSKGATPGNCAQAALASLLDLPLDQVPHIVLFQDWYQAAKLWLDGKNKKLRVYTTSLTVKAYVEFLGAESYWLDSTPLPPGETLLAMGLSHNGPWHHIVLWKDGELLHDTHPNRKGLNGDPIEYWHIIDAEEAA